MKYSLILLLSFLAGFACCWLVVDRPFDRPFVADAMPEPLPPLAGTEKVSSVLSEFLGNTEHQDKRNSDELAEPEFVVNPYLAPKSSLEEGFRRVASGRVEAQSARAGNFVAVALLLFATSHIFLLRLKLRHQKQKLARIERSELTDVDMDKLTAARYHHG